MEKHSSFPSSSTSPACSPLSFQYCDHIVLYVFVYGLSFIFVNSMRTGTFSVSLTDIILALGAAVGKLSKGLIMSI